MDKDRRNTNKFLVIAWAVALLYVLAVVPRAEAITVNQVTSGTLLSPSAAWAFYGSATTHTVGVGAVPHPPPELQELQRALSLGGACSGICYAASVYQYVQNNIDTEFLFGLGKGGYGALIDQSGTAFDQAQLMVMLLRQANITASYQVGVLTLTGAQFQQWTGISSAPYACQMLADGGVPATINGVSSCASLTSGSTISTISLGHIWVNALGALFDPAYKIYTVKSGVGLTTLDQWIGCSGTCGTTILNDVAAPTATSAVGVNQITSVNTTSMASQLQTYAINLQHNIQSSNVTNYQTNPNMQIEDLLGGTVIAPTAGTTASPYSLVGSSAAYSANSNYTWTGDIPDQFRTTLLVQLGAGASPTLNQKLYTDETSGYPLRIYTSNSSVGLYSDFMLVAAGTLPASTNVAANTYVQVLPLTLTLTHSYTTGSGSGSSNVASFSPLLVVNYIAKTSETIALNELTIVAGLGNTTESSIQHFTAIEQAETFFVAPSISPQTALTQAQQVIPWNTTALNASNNNTWVCSAESTWTGGPPTSWCNERQQPTLAAHFLALQSQAAKLVGGVNASRVTAQGTLGVINSGQAFASGQTVMDYRTSVSIESATQSIADQNGAYASFAAFAGRLEGSTLEQSGNVVEGSSAESLLVRSIAQGLALYDITAANLSSATNAGTGGLIAAWSPLITLASGSTLLPTGADLILPSNPNIGTIGSVNGEGVIWGFNGYEILGPQGTSFYGNDISSYYGGNLVSYNGGASAPVDPTALVTQQMTIRDYAQKKKSRADVNLADGQFKLAAGTTLITGTGGERQQLQFALYYSSSWATLDGVLWGGSGVDSTTSSPYECIGIGGYSYPAGLPILCGTDREITEHPIGWRSSLELTAVLGSDGLAAMGRTSASDAASVVAGLYILRQLALNRPTTSGSSGEFQSNVALTFATNWIGQQLVNNVVSVSRPPATKQFTRLPDSTFLDESGEGEVLSQSKSPVSTVTLNSPEMWSYLGMSYSLTERDGAIIQFAYGSAEDADSLGFQPFFEATSRTYPSGEVISFTYYANGPNTGAPLWLSEVSNNLGRKIVFSVNQELTGTTPVPYTVSDESGRTITLACVTFSGCFTPSTSAFQITAPDLTVTQYVYAPTPTSVQHGTYYKVQKIFSADSSTVPLETLTFDSLVRLSTATNNATSTCCTTQYFTTGMFGREWQKDANTVAADGGVTTSYFDKNGNKDEVIDPLGRTSYFTFNSYNKMISHVYPELNSDAMAYDLRGNQLSVTRNPVPGSTLASTKQSTTFNEAPTVLPCVHAATCNQPATATDANSHVTTYAYLASGTGQVERITGPVISTPPSGLIAGQVTGQSQTDYCYSAANGSTGTVSLLAGKIAKVDSTTNRVTAFAYNSSNDWTLSSSIIDPPTTYLPPSTAGGVCTTAAKSSPLNYTTQFVFDAGTSGSGPGNVSAITDADANQTNYTFDSMRRLTSVAPPSSTYAYTRYCYDPDGQLLSTNKWRLSSAVVEANASTLTKSGQCPSPYPTSSWEIETRTYFPTGDLETVADTAGHTTTYAYDPVERKQVVQDAVGRQTATVYDLAGQVLAEWRGGSNWINTSTGQPATSPPLPVATTAWNPVSYGGTGPVRYESYCNGLPNTGSTNCYSPNGKPLYAVDADNHVTAYQYDGFDRLRVTYFPDPNAGTVCTPAESDGASPTCTGQQTYELSAYDLADNRTSLLTRRGDTIGYQYDAANHQIIKSPAGQGAVSSGLDLLGEPYTLTKALYGSWPSHTTSYQYDAAGRKASEANEGLSVGYTYDGVGNRTTTTWPDGYFVSYAYDALNRMQYVRENSTTTNELAYYVYDPLSRRSSLCMGAGASSCATTAWSNQVTYGYEQLDGQLNALTHTLNSTTLSFGYTRNAAYQIQNLTASDPFYLPMPTADVTTNYVANDLNEYASVAGNAFSFDANGNLLTWTPPGSTTAQTDTYDSENRLVSAVITGTTTDSFDYDALGRRVSKTYNGVTTLYLHDADEEIAEYSGSLSSSGTLLRRYVTGPAVDDRIVHVESGSKTPPLAAHTYYHVNHQGSVIDMTDYAGNVSGGVTAGQQLSYDEYGNLSSASNSTGEQFRYTGRRYDAETGLYYYRARYYSPQLGRFLQVDPIGYKDDLDLYTYVGNDPLNGTDPTGEDDVLDEITVTGIRPLPPPPPPPPTIETPSPVSVPIPRLTIPRVTALSLFQEFLLGGCGDSYGSPSCQDGNTMNAKASGKPPVPGATPGQTTRGPSQQWEKSGGKAEADKDFDSLGPKDVKPIPGGRTGTLPDGRSVNVRDQSTDGRPTLEIQDGADRIKVRYN